MKSLSTAGKPLFSFNQYILILLCFAFMLPAAADNLRLIALFKNKAMINLNGKQILLHKGKQNRYHLELLSADSDKAVIRNTVSGKTQTYRLNMLIATNYKPIEQAQVVIWASSNQMFFHPGKINGKNVNFLIDTGASAIAMSEYHAGKLGINYKHAERGQARTASGIIDTWRINLENVQLGDISLQNIGAMILSGQQKQPILLGMTFLGQVNMSREGNKMKLIKKY